MAVSETIGQETWFLGIAILVGAVLFLFYDFLRIFRRIVPHSNLWIGAEDFFYWILYTGVVFVMLYRENDGMVRGFAIGELAFGMLLYFLLLSRYVVRVNVLVLGAMVRGMMKILHYFFDPVRRIGKKVARFWIKELKKFVRAVKMCLCKL